MKTKGKAWHLIVTVLLIVAFVFTAFFGVSAKYGDTTKTYIKGAKDIRFGVDIKGGVNVTFVPSDGYDATEEQLAEISKSYKLPEKPFIANTANDKFILPILSIAGLACIVGPGAVETTGSGPAVTASAGARAENRGASRNRELSRCVRTREVFGKRLGSAA